MRNLVTTSMAEAIKEGICYPFGAAAYMHTQTHSMHMYKNRKRKKIPIAISLQTLKGGRIDGIFSYYQDPNPMETFTSLSLMGPH